MSKMKAFAAGSALGVAILAGPAVAAVTGTVAVTSEYTFRGLDSEAGAAVQGSIDWSDAGFYAGTWASNANFGAGGNELDLYGGYKFKLMETVEVDIGAIYYLFTEDESEGGFPFDLDYPEIYAGVTIGGFAGKLYFTNDYFGVDGKNLPVTGAADGDGTYVNLSYTHTIVEGLTLKGAIGSQSGDGVDAFVGDDYMDYAITLTKALDNGFSVSFGAVGTDLDLADPAVDAGTANSFCLATGCPFEDDVKFVVTLAKGFEF